MIFGTVNELKCRNKVAPVYIKEPLDTQEKLLIVRRLLILGNDPEKRIDHLGVKMFSRLFSHILQCPCL